MTAPGGNVRWVALDHLRGFVVALVVLHHSVLAYCRFGHVDRVHYLWSTAPVVDGARWAGFDAVVAWNDSFFMSLMFLLSGMFVWRSLTRKGVAHYLGDRLVRLGVPLAIGLLTIVPLAYYPSYLEAYGPIGFDAFWVHTILSGAWPSGPFWFIEALLVFDAAAVLLLGLLPRWREALLPWARPRPSIGFLLLLLASACAYLPLLHAFGPARWISEGPFAVQASRIALYALYFGTGVVIGRHGLNPALLGPTGALARNWLGWSLLAAVLAVALVGIGGMRLSVPPWEAAGLRALALIACCATACFSLTAVFLRFGQQYRTVWDSLAVCAYAIFILHYPIVTWTQYGLLDAGVGPIAKGVVVFTVALGVSWMMAVVLRRSPLARHVL